MGLAIDLFSVSLKRKLPGIQRMRLEITLGESAIVRLSCQSLGDNKGAEKAGNKRV
jgi:hypothetical protein